MEPHKLDPEFARTLCERLDAKRKEISSKEAPTEEEIAEAIAAEDIWHLLQSTTDVNAIRHHLNESIRATTICTGTYSPDSAPGKLNKKNGTLSSFHYWRKIHLAAKHAYIRLQTEISIHEVAHA